MLRARPILALAVVLVAAPAQGAGTRRVSSHMYGKRYCEYLVVKGSLPNLTADVWNTFGLNTCPDARWRASDPAALAAQEGALTVVLNGPRHWLVDRVAITLAPGTGEVKRFPNGLRMRLVASVQVPVANGMPDNAPYHEAIVNRRNTFTWSARHRVYELVAPSRRVYVMQSYAQIVDPALSIGALRSLGGRLKLPAGWRFRTRMLRRDLSLTAARRATVVQDDLSNTYQRES
jgi:hypothetical protein